MRDLIKKWQESQELVDNGDAEYLGEWRAWNTCIADLEAAMNDREKNATDNGFRTAPARYMKDDRELIDQHRDKYGDEAFRIHCLIAADEYEYRNGAKGDPAGDAEKAKWYRMMARHVEGNGPDPRADRPGFVPYRRIGGE